MSIFKHAIILAAFAAPAFAAAAAGQGLLGHETTYVSCIQAANSDLANNENITTMQDLIKVATALTGVVGLAGASCMGLAKKRKEKIDSRLVKAIALFPTMPLVVHMIGELLLSQMH